MIFLKLFCHFNQVFKKFNVSYHVSYTIPGKTINNGKTHEVKVPLFEVIFTYDIERTVISSGDSRVHIGCIYCAYGVRPRCTPGAFRAHLGRVGRLVVNHFFT